MDKFDKLFENMMCEATDLNYYFNDFHPKLSPPKIMSAVSGDLNDKDKKEYIDILSRELKFADAKVKICKKALNKLK
jgi:hypothetical protein